MYMVLVCTALFGMSQLSVPIASPVIGQMESLFYKEFQVKYEEVQMEQDLGNEGMKVSSTIMYVTNAERDRLSIIKILDSTHSLKIDLNFQENKELDINA